MEVHMEMRRFSDCIRILYYEKVLTPFFILFYACGCVFVLLRFYITRAMYVLAGTIEDDDDVWYVEHTKKSRNVIDNEMLKLYDYDCVCWEYGVV